MLACHKEMSPVGTITINVLWIVLGAIIVLLEIAATILNCIYIKKRLSEHEHKYEEMFDIKKRLTQVEIRLTDLKELIKGLRSFMLEQ